MLLRIPFFRFYDGRFGKQSAMTEITSRSNEKIKQAVKLRDSSAERKREKLFFLEGVRLCRDACENGVPVKRLYVTGEALSKYGAQLGAVIAASDESYIITQEISLKLSDTKNPQGVFCICNFPDRFTSADKINYTGKYIALENVQTPGNLGAAARTAEALGLDGIIIGGGCDIYNPKALRASMGALLRLKTVETDGFAKFISKLRAKGMNTYAAVPDSGSLPVTEIDRTKGVVCAVGNEGNGLSQEAIASCGEKITIPMKGSAESLNAAAAAAVIMWEMVR